jgi:hypothetical protein
MFNGAELLKYIEAWLPPPFGFLEYVRGNADCLLEEHGHRQLQTASIKELSSLRRLGHRLTATVLGFFKEQ